MSSNPDEGVYNMSERRLRQLHLYKELMTPEERQSRYHLLRISGASVFQAQRWRDWSPNHFTMMLDYLAQSTDLLPDTPGSKLTELTA